MLTQMQLPPKRILFHLPQCLSLMKDQISCLDKAAITIKRMKTFLLSLNSINLSNLQDSTLFTFPKVKHRYPLQSKTSNKSSTYHNSNTKTCKVPLSTPCLKLSWLETPDILLGVLKLQLHSKTTFLSISLRIALFSSINDYYSSWLATKRFRAERGSTL